MSSALSFFRSGVEQVHLLMMCSLMREAPPLNGWLQSLQLTCGVCDMLLPTTVTVAHTFPARAGSVTGAWRFRPLPAAWNGVARPVTCSVSVVVGAVVSVDIGIGSFAWLSLFARWGDYHLRMYS